MEGKINRDYIKSYSASYTNNILDTAFKEGPHLVGRDLTVLCSPEQINYNLLKTIFLQWESEIAKLKSPYFDYQADAVQRALKSFMDVLSRHIRLDKSSLRPLLQQAVEETLYQVFDAEHYYQHSIWPEGTTSISSEELANLKRFVRVNRGLLLELIEHHKDKPEVNSEEYHKFIEDNLAAWKNQWEPVDGYVEAFSKVVALDTTALWAKAAQEPVVENGSPANVNERFAKNTVSLNDKLQKDQTTLADQLNNKKVNSIKDTLTINQRFMFVNELFEGDTEAFGTMLDQIEGCDSYQQALLVIEESKGNFNYDMESDAIKELVSLIARRF